MIQILQLHEYTFTKPIGILQVGLIAITRQVVAIATSYMSLHDFGLRRYCSVRALAGLLQEIKQHGMPSAISRSSIKRARESEFNDYQCDYSPLIRQLTIDDANDDDDAHNTFWYCDSRACLHYMIKKAPPLEQFMLTKLQEHPCTPDKPWGLILYNDEITPGN